MKGVAVALLALVISAGPAFAEAPEWFYGTGTQSAYDKALAHDLALRAAVADAARQCDGTMAGPVEQKTTSKQLSSGEWEFTVTVRAMCQVLGSSP
jgi:hypothetical protein